jgi:branched-chain amino acid transport system permease protein
LLAASAERVMGQVLISIVFDGLAYGMLLFIIAVGLSVTMGLMGFVNLAHGAFAMAGGYATVSLTQTLGAPFLLALVLAFVVVGAVSALFERVLYARLYRASELDQVLLSIGLVLMATAAFTFFYGPAPQRIAVPDWLRGQIELGGRAFPAYRVFLIAVGLGLMAALWLLFERTLIGARIRAAVDNRRMAQSVGIDVDALFTWTFVFGSGLAALGGGLAVEVLWLAPTFAIQYLVFFLIVVTVGGAGSLWGAFVAALLLGFLDNAGKYLWPEGGAFFIYLGTVALLLRKPDGLFGRAHRA